MIAALLSLLAAAAPATAVDAERAFDAMAADKGQWTAFRAFAAPEALMFNPQPVNAQDFLKGRADPPKPVRWKPAATWVSCDGTVAVNTGPWTRPDGSVGYFTTVWQRQPGGEWKWVLDHGDALAKPMPAPSRPKQVRADCRGPAPASGLSAPANSSPGQGKAGEGASPDGSLRWRWTVGSGGARTVAISLRKGREYRQALVNNVTAE